MFAIVSVVIGPRVVATTTAAKVSRNANRGVTSSIFKLKEKERC